MSSGRSATARKRAAETASGVDLGQMLEERIRAIVREELQSHEPVEWVDQTSAPIGRKAYLRLVREGKLPGRKVGRRILVRRQDLDAFIDAHRREEPSQANDSGDDEIDRQLAKLGFLDR